MNPILNGPTLPLEGRLLPNLLVPHASDTVDPFGWNKRLAISLPLGADPLPLTECGSFNIRCFHGKEHIPARTLVLIEGDVADPYAGHVASIPVST